MTNVLLGMPLKEAEARLDAEGRAYRVQFTRAPGAERGEMDTVPRIPFVVEVRDGLLIAAYFRVPNPRSGE